MQRLDFRIQSRVFAPAVIVEINHIIQRRQASVVHVGRCGRHLSQSRRLEFATVLFAPGHGRPAGVRVFPGVCFVKCFVRHRARGQRGCLHRQPGAYRQAGPQARHRRRLRGLGVWQRLGYPRGGGNSQAVWRAGGPDRTLPCPAGCPEEWQPGGADAAGAAPNRALSWEAAQTWLGSFLTATGRSPEARTSTPPTACNWSQALILRPRSGRPWRGFPRVKGWSAWRSSVASRGGRATCGGPSGAVKLGARAVDAKAARRAARTEFGRRDCRGCECGRELPGRDRRPASPLVAVRIAVRKLWILNPSSVVLTGARRTGKTARDHMKCH